MAIVLSRWNLSAALNGRTLGPPTPDDTTNHNDYNLFRLAGLRCLRPDAAVILADWRLLRVLRQQEAEHHD